MLPLTACVGSLETGADRGRRTCLAGRFGFGVFGLRRRNHRSGTILGRLEHGIALCN